MQSLSFSEEFNQSRVISFLATLPEEKVSPIIPNMPASYAKLGYQQIFYQKDNKIIVKELANYYESASTKFSIAKEKHQNGITKFKSMYGSQESESTKRRRRGNSIDNQMAGAYYLNNWQSNQDYICLKPSPEEKTAHIVYEIIAMRWNKAVQMLLTLPRTTQTATLEFLLNGFIAISSLFPDDRFLSQHFLERDKYDINIKLSTESLGGYYNFVNLLEEGAKNKFLQMRNVPRKVQILKINLDYLVKFASNYRTTIQEPYIQLAYKLLGNQLDQQLPIQSQQCDFLKILLRLDLKLSDRLNFATKLLPERKRRQLSVLLQESLCHFPRLQNILFYTFHPSSNKKEQRIQQICRLYLDEYLDLQTIAYLASDYPFLKKYYFQYKQALQLSCQHKKLQWLQQTKGGRQKESRSQQSRRLDQRNANFFQYINIAEEKINDWKSISSTTAIVCEICCKKMLKAQNFLQCGKCRHGGHINHLIKWFQQYQNCAHIGCPCLCN